ncbi:hypothetical protein L2E82_12368 [Cichorium intybus]|uniref:Uncharacterized protein n=1 Tax=Cichorium intybus TaxID=13427 RepID=A0ACB9GGX7_CICIN|nr:hypothetical protein L2E82_12368 [Cichorium intybus]
MKESLPDLASSHSSLAVFVQKGRRFPNRVPKAFSHQQKVIYQEQPLNIQMASSSDPCTREYNKASKLADDITSIISERSSFGSGPKTISLACLLPTLKGRSCGNFARCVNQILQNLNNMQLWLRIPLEKSDVDDAVNGVTDGMEVDLGNFGILFVFYVNITVSIALDVLSSLPSANSLIVLFYIVLSGKAVHKLPVLTKLTIMPNLGYKDFLQSPLQPLMDNLEAETYETHEKDSVGSF